MASKWLGKRRKLNHEHEKSEQPKLDQFTLRFPCLTEKILGQLDNETKQKSYKCDSQLITGYLSE